MQKPLESSQSTTSADAMVGFTQSAATRPPVATFRQYLDGPAEAFEMARRQARAARTQPGGAPDADARRLYAH